MDNKDDCQICGKKQSLEDIIKIFYIKNSPIIYRIHASKCVECESIITNSEQTKKNKLEYMIAQNKFKNINENLSN